MMTPELKNACELVFQEHKIFRKAINWNKDSFRGRLSFGMATLAKQTLENKNIIRAANPAKKTTTVLNPMVAAAGSFEEAEEIIQNKIPVPVMDNEADQREYVTYHVPGVAKSADENTQRTNKIPTKSMITRPEINTSSKSFLYYVLLALSAAAAGASITFLLGLFV